MMPSDTSARCLASSTCARIFALLVALASASLTAAALRTSPPVVAVVTEPSLDPAASYGMEELIGIWLNKTRVGVKQAIEDGFFIAGYAYLNTISWEGPLNAASTFSGTFTFDGPVTIGTET